MQAPDEAAAQLHPSKAVNSPAQLHGPYADEQVQASFQHSQDYLERVASTGNWRTERQPGYTMATHVQPNVPIITLTQPTPPYQEPVTPPKSTEHPLPDQSSQEAAHPPLTHHPQAHHPPPNPHPHHAPPPTAPPPRPIIHFIRRPIPQIQDILQAMATGTFSFPVFGTAGTAFQNRLAARYAPRTPRKVHVNAYSSRPERKTWAALRETPHTPTPTPTPKLGKRKRAEIPLGMDDTGVEGVMEEGMGKRKKVVQEEGSCVEAESS